MANKIYYLKAILFFSVILLLFIKGNFPVIVASGDLMGGGNFSPGQSIPEPIDISIARLPTIVGSDTSNEGTNLNPVTNSDVQESDPFLEFQGSYNSIDGQESDLFQEPQGSYVSGYNHKSTLTPSFGSNLDPSLSAATPTKTNELWVQGQSQKSQYAAVTAGDNVHLVVNPSVQGIADVYELDLDKNALMKYKTEVIMGINTIDLMIQRPGRYILIYVLNDKPSNAVIIDASNGSSPANNKKNTIMLGVTDITKLI